MRETRTMEPEPWNRTDINRRTILAVCSGFAAAVLVTATTGLLASAGHGWSAPIKPSILGWIAFPLTGYALAVNSAQRGRRAAVAALTIMIVCDVWMAMATKFEGWHYLSDTAGHNMPWVLLWAFLWFGSQLFTCAVIILRKSNHD